MFPNKIKDISAQFTVEYKNSYKVSICIYPAFRLLCLPIASSSVQNAGYNPSFFKSMCACPVQIVTNKVADTKHVLVQRGW